jgi:hypothetical protein
MTWDLHNTGSTIFLDCNSDQTALVLCDKDARSRGERQHGRCYVPKAEALHELEVCGHT